MKTLLSKLRESLNGLCIREYPKSLPKTKETGGNDVPTDDPDFALSRLAQTFLPSGVLPDMKCQPLYVAHLKCDPPPDEQ